MNYKLLFCILLLPTTTTYTMEEDKKALELNKKIYALFVANQHQEARLHLPHNNKEATTSLFIHGAIKNNVDFMQWLLKNKKPLFDCPCITSALKAAHDCDHHEIYKLLDLHVRQNKYAIQQENDRFNKIKFDEFTHLLNKMSPEEQQSQKKLIDDMSECRCIIS